MSQNSTRYACVGPTLAGIFLLAIEGCGGSSPQAAPTSSPSPGYTTTSQPLDSSRLCDLAWTVAPMILDKVEKITPQTENTCLLHQVGHKWNFMSLVISDQTGSGLDDPPYAELRATAHKRGAMEKAKDLSGLGSRAFVAWGDQDGELSLDVVWEQGGLVFKVTCYAYDATALDCDEATSVEAAKKLSAKVA